MKILLTIALTAVTTISAIAQSNENNIAAQPAWGPAGYNHADFYFLPEADAYYDVKSKTFICPEGKGMGRRRDLPAKYSKLDLYHTYKAVINTP